jgi:hypothetical protein
MTRANRDDAIDLLARMVELIRWLEDELFADARPCPFCDVELASWRSSADHAPEEAEIEERTSLPHAPECELARALFEVQHSLNERRVPLRRRLAHSTRPL